MAEATDRVHRWIATHQGLYVALVVGVLLVGFSKNLATFGRWALLVLGIVAVTGLAAWMGAVLVRRKVEQYDARAGE